MTNGLPRAQRVTVVALGATAVLTAAKVIAWGTTGSLVVLSQAVDSALDVVALALVFVALRVATKPADASHHYGHAKAEHLVAFTQTLLLGGVVLGIVIEAVLRLGESSPRVSAPWYAIALLGASVVVDGARALLLGRAAAIERSDALRSGALNAATDIGTALVALVSLVLVRGGTQDADAIGSLVVAAAVVVAAFRLGRRSVDVLMDRAPSAPVQAIARAAATAPGVAETRRVRVRSAGSQLFADVTVAAGRTASLERAHDIAEGVEREIQRVAPGSDVVVHVEPTSETTGLVERVHAAASRTDGVHEVHNIGVHAFDEGGRRRLHVTLHAKVAPDISLAEAHELSERVESAVTEELGRAVRVDTHIEPLETTAFGRDVTASRDDVVAAVRSAALQEPDVADCHEVIVTSSGAELAIVAHVSGRSDLALSRLHDASERIESKVRADYPTVGQVLIHFEPTDQP